MRAFFGGQIKEKQRGDFAAVITREQIGDNLGESYNAFLEPVSSAEFVYLTGIGEAKNPVQRAYIGVSAESGKRIVSAAQNGRVDPNTLRTIDEIVVTPHFLAQNLEKPEEIVLRSTREGYRVVEE
jgi:hypothetical protein